MPLSIGRKRNPASSLRPLSPGRKSSQSSLCPLVLGFEFSLGLGLGSVWSAVASEAQKLVNCLTDQSSPIAADWPRLGLLLRSSLKLSNLSRIQYSQAELETCKVAEISRRFKECIVETPVISIFETLATKVPKGLLGSETRIVSTRTSD
ncbi:hypothetical protein IL306_012663 [Fusarium sp. DS 682]|nr:hypothetical protein IL306_012663 [Fusarium sp. DS 682]